MAIKTGSGSEISFDRAFESIEQLAASAKQLATALRNKCLASTVTGRDIITYFQDTGTVRQDLQGWAAKITDTAAANAYARDRYNNPSYNAVNEYNALNAALNSTMQYIAANIPTNLLTWDEPNGDVTWNVFTSAQTAALQTELNAIIATVD